MKFSKTIASVAATAAVLVVTANAASASQASSNDCLRAGKQATIAINNNTASANASDAKKERALGYNFCMSGAYDQGVAHFAKAVEIVGGTQQAQR